VDFTSLTFLAFLAACAVAYRFVRKGWRCGLLVLASYYFYWTWARWFAVLLLGATLMAYFAARARRALLGAVAVLVGVVVFFKAMPLTGAAWLIPLGVSYYTFKLAGYLIDVHWGKVEPETRLVPFLAYSSFFPQIVGGPIQRAESFLPQAKRAEPARAGMVVMGMHRILLGFFKKAVIADNLGTIVNYVYGHLTGAPVLLGFYGYPLQMYADFSGLTDIAIGAAMMFGIESPENFNAPFFAASPSEYWRRWHITLTLWLTDYVFMPLRMATRNWGDAGLVFSLFVNMVLIGLWHGFRWTFALFGVVHAIYLSVDALTMRARKRFYKGRPGVGRAMDWVGPVVTFHLVAVAFVFFRADGIAQVGAVFSHLLDGLGTSVPGRSLWVLAGAYVVMEFLDWGRRRLGGGEWVAGLPRWGRWSVYSCTGVVVVFVVLLLLAGGHGGNHFLYAVF
jgi:alginate O-acetyltransferase complex protein AlgI